MGAMLGQVAAVGAPEQDMTQAMSGMTMMSLMLGMMRGFIG